MARHRSRSSARASRWQSVALIALVLPVGGWVGYEAQRQLRADFVSMGARKQVTDWATGVRPLPRSAAEWEAARADLQRAVEITPDSPVAHESLGDAYLVAGQMVWDDEAARRPHFETAIAQYRIAIELRPGYAQTWAALAGVMLANGERGAPLHEAWARALQYGPNEGHVQPMLLKTALAAWDDASPQMQEWVLDFYERSNPARRKTINREAQPYGLRFEAEDEAKP